MDEAHGLPNGIPVSGSPVQRIEVHRIKTRPQFQAVLAGQTVSRTPHFALHRLMLAPAGHVESSAGPVAPMPQALFDVPGPWIGTVVPKRWARRAVTRNLIKRQVHAVAREIAAALPGAAHVVRLRVGFERSQFSSASSTALRQAVRAELQRLFSGARA